MPIFLHLHVTAETIIVSDYIKLYGDFDKFHIDNYALAVQRSSMCCIQQDEMDFQKFVLNQIIK